jgi:HisJ family histidinol phosphate phosphatase
MSQPASIYDLHIHTEFSPDSQTPLEAYAQVAEQKSIHIGFLDHFELAFLERPDYLNYDNLPRLLEDFEQTQKQYPNISLGLEVDYYSARSTTVAEFCDDFRKDFDYFIGTVHTLDGLAVTTKEELDVLIKRIGLPMIVQRYFDEVEGAIRSGLFEGIAHLDGVMRFVPMHSNDQELIDFWYQRTLEVGKECQKWNVIIEVNLRGLVHPWGKLHPSQSIIEDLMEAGAQFYVGSDSHSISDFEEAVPQLQQLHRFLREHGGFKLPNL